MLDALAAHFIQSRYDLKHLVRTICKSQTYQFSAMPNEHNVADKQNFSRYYPKRLSAESLLDAVDQVTGSRTGYNGMPAGTRAVELPDTRFASYFLTVFGQPESSRRLRVRTLDRSQPGPEPAPVELGRNAGKTLGRRRPAAALAADKSRPSEEKIGESLFAGLPRGRLCPTKSPPPKSTCKRRDDKVAYEDIIWALINTKEFLFNH